MLYRQPIGVCNPLQMIVASLIIPENYCLPYGTHYVDHLTADGACLLGGQVTVIALLEVDANFP